MRLSVVDAVTSSFMQSNHCGALQYRTSYSKRTNLGHNSCVLVATAEEICGNGAVRKFTGICEIARSAVERKSRTSDDFIPGGPLDGLGTGGLFSRSNLVGHSGDILQWLIS